MKVQRGIVVLCLIASGCGNVRGAYDPFAYAPKQPWSAWIPPETIKAEALPVQDFSFLMDKAALTLAESLDIALLNTPTTQKSWAIAREAAAAYGQSLQNYYLLTDINGGYAREKVPFFYQTATGQPEQASLYATGADAGININYTILDFGQTRYTAQAALQALYSADFTHNQTIQDVVRTVMDAYYGYLYNKERLKADEQDILDAQTVLNMVLEKLTTGVADISDKVQATTKLLEQQLKAVTERQQLANSYAALLRDMGLPANLEIAFENYPKATELFSPPPLDCLFTIAARKRPELLSARAQLRSKEAGLQAAKSERYPTITGAFNIDTNYTNFTPHTFYTFLGAVQLSFPVFQGFFIENTIKSAKAQLEAAQAGLTHTELQIYEEITALHSDVIYAKEGVEYAQNYLQAAEEEFQVTLLRYEVGTGTIVELINAQTAVSNARAQLIEKQKNWYTSLAGLAHAAGTLSAQEIDFGIQTIKISGEDDGCEKSEPNVSARRAYTGQSSGYQRGLKALESP